MFDGAREAPSLVLAWRRARVLPEARVVAVLLLAQLAHPGRTLPRAEGRVASDRVQGQLDAVGVQDVLGRGTLARDDAEPGPERGELLVVRGRLGLLPAQARTDQLRRAAREV